MDFIIRKMFSKGRVTLLCSQRQVDGTSESHKEAGAGRGTQGPSAGEEDGEGEGAPQGHSLGQQSPSFLVPGTCAPVRVLGPMV